MAWLARFMMVARNGASSRVVGCWPTTMVRRGQWWKGGHMGRVRQVEAVRMMTVTSRGRRGQGKRKGRNCHGLA
ncbi:hypothetical protein E2562_006735 [Oryza meyeriana var. granulata]|uniref:Uncharacterized protein n=1 Tax=Oryza meyeriana var. granulata TaxID=110450 RepID=A0A6G1EGB6_9ORYZ|nr:hypothetical protein E2562_002387 [Oryza meyeriana var. granulata]KAF0923777.1 hypothetical protein E2562_006735 [Oryza meyeriana var. granulata]